jgi:DNA-binding CsgD family transcriptional regulator
MKLRLGLERGPADPRSSGRRRTAGADRRQAHPPRRGQRRRPRRPTLCERGVEIHHRDWHGGRKSYGDTLSPRETEVVRLLVAGRSNPEIAKVLGKSPYTVDNQVKSAMRSPTATARG